MHSNELQGSINTGATRLNGLSGGSRTKCYAAQRKEKSLGKLGKGFIKVTFQEGEITWETVKSLKGIKLFSLLRTQ